MSILGEGVGKEAMRTKKECGPDHQIIYDPLHFFQDMAYVLRQTGKNHWQIWSKHDLIHFVSKGS